MSYENLVTGKIICEYYLPQSKDAGEGRQRCHQWGNTQFSVTQQVDGGHWGLSSLSQLLVWNTLSLHARGLPWAVELFPCPRRSRNGEGSSVPHGPAAREQGTWSGRPPAALSLSLAADVFRRPPPLSPVLRLGLAIVLDSSAYSILLLVHLSSENESCLR